MEKLALTFVGLSILPLILTETHWLVTENGRIHSMAESLFNMAQSHDLVQFLRQEDRVRRSDEAKNRLTSQKSVIRSHEQKDDPQVEARLMQTDPDCILAGKPLAQQDLFLSTVMPLEMFGIRIMDRIGRVTKASSSKSGSVVLPFCTQYVLPFSAAAFDHLEAIIDRKNLSSAPEPGLSQIAFDDWINTTDFAHAVGMAMLETPGDWLLFTLASYYWRFLGDGAEGIECLRRALHLVPREYAVIPMLSLANLLHQSSRSKDGAIVVDTAINFNDSIPQLYFTAGHIYSVSLQYEKAIDAFDRVLKLDNAYSLAKQHQASVRCHQKLESALETQHQNLQKTLTELQSYQVRLKNFQTLHEEMLRHVVDSETRQLSALTYDHIAYGPLEGLLCNTTSVNGQMYIDCDIEDFVAYKSAKREILDGVGASSTATKDDETKSTAEERVDQDRTAETPSSPKPSVDTNEEKQYLDSLEMYRDWDFSAPSKPRRYQLSSPSQIDSSPLDRPSDEECQNVTALPRPDSMYHLFLSPENKGFDIQEILTKYLNLNETQSHPLPWYPPFCSPHLQPELHLDCCDHLLGVQRAKVRERERVLPENGLRQVISSLAPGLSNSEAEFGQRVLTLLNYNIVTKWIAYNLAALYWRLIGVTAEAAACLRLALTEEGGKKYTDVALFQLSYLAFSAGNRVDDAINLLRQATEADDQEPDVHFILCMYLISKENHTGAAFHLRKALELKPTLDNGQEWLLSLKCKIKETTPETPKPAIERPPLSRCSEKEKGPKFFCMREDGEERCYLEERMLPGSSVEQSDMIMCPACNMQHCLKPPPLASIFLSMVDKSGKKRDAQSKEKPKEPVQAPASRPLLPLAPAEEPEEIENELSLIDASMQPGSSDAKETPIPDREVPAVVSEPLLEEKAAYINAGQEEDNQGTKQQQPIMLEQLKATVAGPRSDEAKTSKVSPPTKSKNGVAVFTDLDSSLPDILPTPSPEMIKAAASLVAVPATTAECVFWKSRVKVEQPISTYLSVSAKGINVQTFVDFSSAAPKEQLEPLCPSLMPSTMWTMDHLNAYIMRHNLTHYRPESGLKDAFQKLGGSKESIETVANRVAHAMKKNLDEFGDQAHLSWVLTTVAALYWRVQGNASMAIDCLRHAVSEAPYYMKDLALVSLANVYHQSGYLHSALITAGAALHVSPKFVVVHFTLANIYAALGDWERAMMFYYSTLSLQGNLEAAKDRIRAIYCATGVLPRQVQ